MALNFDDPLAGAPSLFDKFFTDFRTLITRVFRKYNHLVLPYQRGGRSR